MLIIGSDELPCQLPTAHGRAIARSHDVAFFAVSWHNSITLECGDESPLLTS
jgi:hypothetical protein